VPQLRAFTPYQMEHSGRLVQPMILEKGSQHYRPIDWSEAMERIAAKLKATAQEE
jgi:anaerobic selenocysteine-containing dehydrogenase